MDELQALQHELEDARDEAELNLLQLQQVQEELEFYLLRCQELDREVEALKQAPPAPADALATETAEPQEITNLREILAQTQAQLEQLQSQRQQEQHLLSTAQAMLEGQARYLEDVSLREENAAQAIDRLRLLEAEILYYLRHSRPLASLDPDRINRLVQLAKQPSTSG
jgi:hypothetical protein